MANNVLLDSTTSAGAVTNAGAFLMASSNTTEQLQLKGTLHNSGTITLQAGNNTGNSTLDQSDIYVQLGDVTLDGGGSIVFAGAWGRNEITGADPSTSTTLHNVNNQITGFGFIGAGGFTNAPTNKLVLDNQAAGVINANSGAGQPLTLTNLTVSNAGILEATGAGGLAITSATIAQAANGLIVASGTNTHIDLTAATIQGGTLTTSAGGVVNVFGNADLLDSTTGAGAVTNSASIVIASNGSGIPEALLLKGTLHNSGTITLLAGNNTGNSVLDQSDIFVQTGDVTLDGGGSVLFAGGWGRNEITGANTSTPTTLHNVNNQITGFGFIGNGGFANAPANLLFLDNQAAGVINANSGGGQPLTLTNLTVSNAGILEATGAGGLAITSATIAQAANGLIVASGTNTHIDLTAAVIQGGTLATSAGGVVNVLGNADLLDSTTAAGAVINAASIVISSSNVLEALH